MKKQLTKESVVAHVGKIAADGTALVKKRIIDKNGKATTVYVRQVVVDPKVLHEEDWAGGELVRHLTGEEDKKGEQKSFFAVKRTKIRRPEEEQHIVSQRSQKVYSQAELDEDYKRKHPTTMHVLESGKWRRIPKSDRFEVRLPQSVWAKIIKEHEPFVHTLAKKYAFGNTRSERYEELMQVGNAGVHEAMNMYGKHLLARKKAGSTKPVIKQLMHVYVKGRMKEVVHNRMIAGLRIPSYLDRPYQMYKQVKTKLSEEFGGQPSFVQLKEALGKVWTKKDFYPSYLNAEERDYGTVPVVVRGKATTTRQKRFTDLTPKQQKEEKEADLLPMDGWISVSKTGVVKNKLEKHKERLNKINGDFKNALELLKTSQFNHGERSDAEKQQELDAITRQQQIVDNAYNGMLIDMKKKDAVAQTIYDEMEVLQEKLEKLERTVPENSKHADDLMNERKSVVLQLKKYQSSEFFNRRMKRENQDYNIARHVWEVAKKELEQLKEHAKRFEGFDFERRRDSIEAEYRNAIESEVRRYNNDIRSSRIPGVEERLKEFEQIDSIKEVPLGVTVEDDEGSGTPTVEFISPENALSPEEIQETITEHTNAKMEMERAFEKLKPIYHEVFTLHIGMHEKSKPTRDNLWGELMSDNEIISFLDKKHQARLKISPEKYAAKFAKYDNDQLVKLQGVLPYVVDKYRNNFRSLQIDLAEWKSKRPGSKKEKVRVPKAVFKKSLMNFFRKKRQARKVWKAWRKRNKDLSQAQSVKKYIQIKEKFGALKRNKPKRFILKVVPPTKMKLDAWKNKKPQLFYASESGKRKWLESTLQDAKSIVRATTPKDVVRNWLASHRKLVESGISVEKAVLFDLEENQKFVEYYKRRQQFEDIYGTSLEKSVIRIATN